MIDNPVMSHERVVSVMSVSALKRMVKWGKAMAMGVIEAGAKAYPVRVGWQKTARDIAVLCYILNCMSMLSGAPLRHVACARWL